MIMAKVNLIQQKITTILLERNALSSSDIHATLTRRGEAKSLVTIKRSLLAMARAGPATVYNVLMF